MRDGNSGRRYVLVRATFLIASLPSSAQFPIGCHQLHDPVGTMGAKTVVQVDGGAVLAGATTTPGSGRALAFVRMELDGSIGWAKTYDTPDWDVLSSMVHPNSGGYALCGYNYTGVSDMHLLKVDDQGEVEWQHRYGRPGHDQPYAMATTSDGGYVLVGRTDGVGSSPQVAVVRLDAQGELIWSRALGEPGRQLWGDAVLVMDNGDIVVSGESWTAGVGDLVLLALTDDGDLLWNKRYDLGGDERGIALAPAADGILVCGDITHPGPDILTMKVSRTGQVQWSEQIGQFFEYPNAIRQLDDGSYLIVAQTDLAAPPPLASATAIRMEADGALRWTMVDTTALTQQFIGVDVDVDGGFLLTGVRADDQAGPAYINFTKLDASGVACIGCGGFAELPRLPLPVSIDSTTLSYEEFATQMEVVFHESDLVLTVEGTSCGFSGVSDLAQASGTVLIAPMPITNTAEIHVPREAFAQGPMSFEVVDACGRSLQQVKLLGPITILDSGGIAGGIYHYRVDGPGGRYATGSFVIE